VTTIDYSQNIALPHAASTPSSWYFMSLIWVSVFGLFTENTATQTNCIYSEQVAGKGSNEVISMLEMYAKLQGVHHDSPGGKKTWIIYADNCGGQNKNNHVLRYLLFLVDTGRVKTIHYNFFIKGHTKNACDRGFGTMRQAYVKKDLYTMEHIWSMIEFSSTSNTAINLEDKPNIFKDWKNSLEPIYQDVKSIQKYQLFTMDKKKPGVISCQKGPTSAPMDQHVLKRGVAKKDVAAVWTVLPNLPPAGANPEKVSDLHKKILPFIPLQYQSDPMYCMPTTAETIVAKGKKLLRRKVVPKKAKKVIKLKVAPKKKAQPTKVKAKTKKPLHAAATVRPLKKYSKAAVDLKKNTKKCASKTRSCKKL